MEAGGERGERCKVIVGVHARKSGVTDQSLLARHRDVAQTANLVASIVASALKFDEPGLGRFMDAAVARRVVNTQGVFLHIMFAFITGQSPPAKNRMDVAIWADHISRP